MKPKRTTKDLEVSKSNALIRSSYRLTIIEQQLVLYAIAMARETQTGINGDTPLTINARSFAETFGIAPQNVYKQLEQAVDGLFERWISFAGVDIETGVASRVKTRWISDATYIDGLGQIQFTFARLLAAHITRLDPGFTRYQLSHIARLTSGHAIKLFEMMMQFKSTGWVKITKEDLRFRFGLYENEYPLTNDLKRKVIKVAVDQINENTNWTIKYEDIKPKRAVTGFLFRFYEAEPPIPEEKPAVPPFDDAWIASRARPGETGVEARERLYPIYKREVLLIDDNQVEMAL
jgi:plasmid replication initiation protein